jgi:hypothetical protein
MALRITAIYLIFAGVIGSIWPLLNLGPNHPELEAQSIAYQMGSYVRGLSISLAFLISGIGILKIQLLARKVGLVALAFAFFYGGNAIAWGWSGGKPQTQIVVYSYLMSFVLYGIWFLILYRRSTITQLTRQSSAMP